MYYKKSWGEDIEQKMWSEESILQKSGLWKKSSKTKIFLNEGILERKCLIMKVSYKDNFLRRNHLLTTMFHGED